MSGKPLLVSYSPPPGHRRWRKPGPCSNAKLQRLFGLTADQMAETFDSITLLDKWPGRRTDCPGTLWAGELWGLARASALELAPTLRERPMVLLLGRAVREAFRPWVGESPRLFKPRARHDLGTVLVPWPSPSGSSRFWCCPQNQSTAEAAARAVMAAIQLHGQEAAA
ncbi:hypothetical protein [Engelhardtia mirabilis]|uniref:Uracil DNA glycosylase superfamily protein n=1 Tax=Engelhardtia mirabilis TaxID=2528011 RepID=A0A518BL65_9BACT|nr:hypothetical protein Pla133_28100 [Planctomycetes bacterium Pla133]QDV02048.1 hypothetical protein Pla86_28090 [Planctomycetes bacterium Pla86]